MVISIKLRISMLSTEYGVLLRANFTKSLFAVPLPTTHDAVHIAVHIEKVREKILQFFG